MSIHTDPTDPWTRGTDDDVPLRPDGNVAIAWRDLPAGRHFIEQAVVVYLRLDDAGRRWIVDGSSLDGYALDSSHGDLSAQRGECPCAEDAACEAARAAADQLPLPTGRELAALIVEAL